MVQCREGRTTIWSTNTTTEVTPQTRPAQMNNGNRHFGKLLLTIVAVVGVVVSNPVTCDGNAFDLPKAGILLSLPDPWKQVPDEELAAVTQQARAKAPKISISSYAYGFRKESGDSWGLIVVSVRPRQMSNPTLEAMPQAEDWSEYSKIAEQKTGGLLRGFKMGQSRYDSKRQIVWITMSAADVMGGGGMKGVSAVLIRESQEIQLNGYCDEASYESFCSEFEGVVISARTRVVRK